MRFWDSSAIIPLCVKERTSKAVEGLLKGDENVVVWWTTRVECLSALSRRRREGVLSSGEEVQARAVLSALAAAWSEVQPTEIVRLRAERLLSVHPLRTGDALQLAAALIWAEETPRSLEFVCLDQNLREAALKEGFSIQPYD
jgi:predicted nucleic acid-binding protein